MEIKRVIIIVLDGVGIGALPDAGKYGDQGANSLGNLKRKLGKLNLPYLEKLGLGKVISLSQRGKAEGSYGKLAEASAGKDTLSGHWEIAGLVVKKPFPLYPKGFPRKIIKELEKRIGRPTLGNYPASGTEIIQVLGKKHLETGYPIIYTSADSVFQIAAHEEIIPRERLYQICQIARQILKGRHRVARVIARPFRGKEGNFYRTPYRQDFGVSPFQPTLLDKLKKKKRAVIGIGKIGDIFNHSGLTDSYPTKNNQEGIRKICQVIRSSKKKGLIFANLIDFDMLYGHRRDPQGYLKALQKFDQSLPRILQLLGEEDLLFITSDHGCDPTFSKHTDHTREYVPLLVYGKKIKSNLNLGERKSFADLGQTVADFLGINPLKHGVSFKEKLM